MRRRISPREVGTTRSAGFSFVPAMLFAVRVRSASSPSGVRGSGCGNSRRAAFAWRWASRTAGSIPVTRGFEDWNSGMIGFPFGSLRCFVLLAAAAGPADPVWLAREDDDAQLHEHAEDVFAEPGLADLAAG